MDSQTNEAIAGTLTSSAVETASRLTVVDLCLTVSTSPWHGTCTHVFTRGRGIGAGATMLAWQLLTCGNDFLNNRMLRMRLENVAP